MQHDNLRFSCISRIVAACLFAFQCSHLAVAQSDTTRQSVAVSMGVFLVGSTLSVYTHELGHLSFAYLSGATSAHINLWPPTTTQQFPHDASKFQKTFPALAGPLTTRVLSEGIDYLLNSASPPRWIQTIGSGWYLAMRMDLPWQVLTSTISHLATAGAKRRDDIYMGLIEPWFDKQGTRNVVYLFLVISQIIDIYLDADEIAHNYRRMFGKLTQPASDHAGTLHLLPNQQARGIIISYGVRF